MSFILFCNLFNQVEPNVCKCWSFDVGHGYLESVLFEVPSSLIVAVDKVVSHSLMVHYCRDTVDCMYSFNQFNLNDVK